MTTGRRNSSRRLEGAGSVGEHAQRGHQRIVECADLLGGESSDELMAVDVAVTETGFEAGTPRRLFSVRGRIDTSSRGEIDIYAPASDGQRFLFLLRTENLVVPPLRVIVNWPSLMNR